MGIKSFMFHVNSMYATKHNRQLIIPNFPTDHFTTLEQVAAATSRVVSHLKSVLTPNDFVIVPTHSIQSSYFTRSDFQQLSSTGARTIVYLLGVAFPHDSHVPSNNGHGLVVGYNLRDVTHRFAQILPLSHYIHEYFSLPHNPARYVSMSPLEEVFYIYHHEYMQLPEEERRAAKENLILIDSDIAGDLWLPPDILSNYQVVLLNGLTVGELISLFKRAKVIIDLHFNGPERTVWEAILFECYPIISHQGNGGDDVDIPVPNQYKIDAVDADLDHESGAKTNDLLETLR
jgi:hypothetical protein